MIIENKTNYNKTISISGRDVIIIPGNSKIELQDSAELLFNIQSLLVDDIVKQDIIISDITQLKW